MDDAWGSREDLDRLSTQLTPEEMREVEQAFRKQADKAIVSKRTTKQAQRQSPPQKPKSYRDLEPEKLDRLTDSITGLRKVRDEMLLEHNGHEKYSKLAKHKAEQRVFGGKEPTAENVAKAIKDVNTRRYLKECLGEENVSKLDNYVKEYDRRVAWQEKYNKQRSEYESKKTAYDRKIEQTEKAEAKQRLERGKDELEKSFEKKVDDIESPGTKIAKTVGREGLHFALKQFPLPHSVHKAIIDAVIP